jgi:hypothetical protein
MIAKPVALPTALVRHPDAPCGAVDSIQCFLDWKRSGVLTITYLLNGAVDQLRIPPYQSTRRADGLWRSSCFEAFVGAKNDAEYYEFNFSPSGEWAVYQFRDYRDGGPIEVDRFEPVISVRQESRTLELCAVIRLDHLPELQLDVRLSVGLSAVIKGSDARLSYWALKHPPGEPDFHHPDSFVIEINSSVAGAGTIAYTANP